MKQVLPSFTYTEHFWCLEYDLFLKVHEDFEHQSLEMNQFSGQPHQSTGHTLPPGYTYPYIPPNPFPTNPMATESFPPLFDPLALNNQQQYYLSRFFCFSSYYSY